MKLTCIIDLYREMKKSEQLRQQFDFEYNGVIAAVMFFIDQPIFELLFGIKGSQESFSLEVKSGFVVADYFDPLLYNKIIRLFHIGRSCDHIYHPKDFWEAFSIKVPRHISKTRPALPIDIAPYRSDIEEADKLYFAGFIDQNKSGNRARNFEKTRLLMGDEAYRICLKNNLSTKWTNQAGADRFSNWREMLPLP